MYLFVYRESRSNVFSCLYYTGLCNSKEYKKNKHKVLIFSTYIYAKVPQKYYLLHFYY